MPDTGPSPHPPPEYEEKEKEDAAGYAEQSPHRCAVVSSAQRIVPGIKSIHAHHPVQRIPGSQTSRTSSAELSCS